MRRFWIWLLCPTIAQAVPPPSEFEHVTPSVDVLSDPQKTGD